MKKRWENPFDCAPNDDIASEIMYTVEWVGPTCEEQCWKKVGFLPPVSGLGLMKSLWEIPDECKNLEGEAFRECWDRHFHESQRQMEEFLEKRKKDPTIRKKEKEFWKCVDECVENYKLQIAEKYGVDPECVEALWAEY